MKKKELEKRIDKLEDIVYYKVKSVFSKEEPKDVNETCYTLINNRGCESLIKRGENVIASFENYEDADNVYGLLIADLKRNKEPKEVDFSILNETDVFYAKDKSLNNWAFTCDGTINRTSALDLDFNTVHSYAKLKLVSDESRIKELRLATEEEKELFYKHFPKTFEVGDFIIDEKDALLIVNSVGGGGISVNNLTKELNCYWVKYDKFARLATDKEILKRLAKIAKLKGYKKEEGVDGDWCDSPKKICGEFKLDEFYNLVDKISERVVWRKKDNKWAEIVEEKTKLWIHVYKYNNLDSLSFTPCYSEESLNNSRRYVEENPNTTHIEVIEREYPI